MILAELEFFHSRAIAPTRRVALGECVLPCDPAPGFGGVLLGCVVAANHRSISEDRRADLTRLTHELEDGRRVPQPRLRYRFQADRVGLLRSRARLVRRDGTLDFEFDDQQSMPAQRVLAAVYAAGGLPKVPRQVVFAAIRRAMRWPGPIGPALFASLAGAGGGPPLLALTMEDPIGWALEILGFEEGVEKPTGEAATPARGDVQRQFRELLRVAHPDHGGDAREAAQRIAALREARRILLAG